MKIDYTIKGTKLPFIPKGTEYRVIGWDFESENDKTFCNNEDFISFGWNHYKGYTYILCENPSYKGMLHLMIKLSDIEKLTETKETMKTITYIDAQKIVDIACSTWKDLLFNSWGKDIVLKRYINIPSENYQEMRKACTSEQHKLFDEIFGEDKPNFKIGDWVYCKEMEEEDFRDNKFIPCFQIKDFNIDSDYARPVKDKTTGVAVKYLRLATEEEIKAANVFPDGTPCLVRDYNTSSWHLQYADGKGSFYRYGKKYGDTSKWKYSMKLDIDNLPVNK
jgi:hypothetical protein